MSFSLGIVGLPNVGKSTLFHALTKKKVDAANYPFCTIDPNVGVVAVPDERLAKLAVLSQSEKIIPTTIEFVDIAGLVKGASKGEGLGNKFLQHIRQVDAIVHVTRSFRDENVIHVHGEINPKSDQETINLELILADLEVAEKRLAKLADQMKGAHDKKIDAEHAVIHKIVAALRANNLVSDMELSVEEFEAIKSHNFLTAKPQIYIYNVSEQELSSDLPLPAPGLKICAQLESELAELPANDIQAYLQQSGIKETGLDQLIRKSYELLGLVTFLTTGPMETKAWTITTGTKAPQAAGVIHSDFEKHFIRVEAVNWQELLDAGSWAKAKELGKIRTEGKDYIVKDGDTVFFHTGA